MPRRRRRLSMTSLIDVIFLLLLFFMLSSTFSRFAEIELMSAGAGPATPGDRPVFLSLGAQALRLNGVPAEFAALPDLLAPHRAGERALTVLIAAEPEVTSQRLTDLLVALRVIPQLSVTVLEAT